MKRHVWWITAIAALAALPLLAARISSAQEPLLVGHFERVLPEDPEVRDLAKIARDMGLEFQADLLADGAVELSEYRLAIDKTVECLENRGWEAEGDLRGITVTNPGVPDAGSPEEALQSVNSAFDDCEREYKYLVESVFMRAGGALGAP